jgi:hypothetical protein
MKNKITFSIEDETVEIIDEHAKNYQGNRSMTLDMLVAEWRYLTAKQAALGKRPQAEPEYHGEGVA